MQKNSPEVLSATGLYSSLAKSISFSVWSAISCLTLISSDTSFASDKILIASDDPNISSVSYNVCNIESSISFSFHLFFAPSSTNACFSVSKSGFSFATTIAWSWSVSPSYVIIKFNKVTLVETSGK